MSTDLITIEPQTIPDIFTKEKGADPILEKIEAEVRKFIPDISTKKGREEVASMAHKVAKTKTYMDSLGKSLTEDMKRQAKVVDSSRNIIWGRLEKLQKEVREPLTAWENKEKNRVAGHESAILGLIELGSITHQGHKHDLEQLKDNLESLKAKVIDEKWEEFQDRAAREQSRLIESLTREISDRERYQAEQEELNRLRTEKAARDRQEYEDRIAKEAADKARLEAEDKARKEREAIELAKSQELEAAAKESQRIENEKKEAIRKQKDAEDRLAQERERARLAEIKAKEDKEKAEKFAVEAERLKVQRLKEQEEKEQLAREADLEHKKKINNEALSAIREVLSATFVEPDMIESVAKAIITKIAKGQVPHIKINY